jgi:ATP adenylyltransferase
VDYLWTPWRYAYLAGPDRGARPGVPQALAAWPGDAHCVFCNLVAAADYAVEHGMSAEQADQAANIVLRSEKMFVCLNSFPYSTGHLMIVPYAHIDELAALDPVASLEMMSLAQSAERVLRQTYSPQGLNLGLNLGQAAGAGVTGHLHLHVLPRWIGDSNFMTVVAETRVLPEALEVTWKRLRDGFAALER